MTKKEFELNEKNVVRTWLVFCVLLGLSLAIYLFFFDPVEHPILPPCSLNANTGLLCLSCGATRSTHHLVHGRILLGIRCNPYYICVLLVLMYFMLRAILEYFFNYRLPKIPFGPKMLIAFITVTALFVILRNIPYFPFTYLGPPVS